MLDKKNISCAFFKLNEPLTLNHLKLFQQNSACNTNKITEKEDIGWTKNNILHNEIDESCFKEKYISLSLRFAIKKVSTSLLNAKVKIAELEYKDKNNYLTISNKNKTRIKEECLENLQDQAQVQFSFIPFVYDVANQVMYVGASSINKLDKFISFFIKTCNISCIPITPQVLCQNYLKQQYFEINSFNSDDLIKNEFIGREFLTWLLYFTEEIQSFKTNNKLIQVLLDGPINFVDNNKEQCQLSLKDNNPTLSDEAQTALLLNKKIIKANLTLCSDELTWQFNFDADNFIIKSLKLPPIESILEEEQFIEKLSLLDEFKNSLTALFHYFIDESLQDDFKTNFQTWLKSRKN